MIKKKLALVVLTALFASGVLAAEVRDAELAGQWYPGSEGELRAMLSSYLQAARPPRIDGEVFALISPHAGYPFSGPVAAYGFKALAGKPYKTVVIIGFSHRKPFDGIAVCAKGAFKTPLGAVMIDEELAGKILAQNPRIQSSPDIVFGGENSIEMQVPFIQAAFKDARIVPIAFGAQEYNDASLLADALANVLKGTSGVLVVASTDMSHYHPYEEARSIDTHTIAVLKNMKAQELFREGSMGISELCGVMPVTAALLLAEKMGYDKIEILKYANSGDTSGDKSKVVGYVSAAIYKERNQPALARYIDGPGKPEYRNQKMDIGDKSQDSGKKENIKYDKEGETRMLNDAQRKRLLEIARESIISYVRDGKKKSFTENDPVLNQPCGAFVTLHEAGELRGCIGNMVGQGPLYQTVAEMAIEASIGDPRFPKLSAQEIDKVDIEISVLSPLKRVSSADEIKIPGHGVIVKKGFRSGVYLPQVATETGWTKEEFLTSLCAHKAGLSPDAWKEPGTEIYVFTAEVFGEK